MFSIYEIILLFFVISIGGWIWEVILGLIQHKKFINRGFLIGPYIPIYGCGGLITNIIFTNLNMFDGVLNIIYIFVVTTILASILEYFTSWLLETIFNNRWWDYSNFKFNINGRICLLCSVAFGIAGTLTYKLFNPAVRQLLDYLNPSLDLIKGIDLILIIIFVVDIMLSFRILNTLKNISNSIKEDSTDKISRQVRKIIFNNYNLLYKRVINSFPTMIVKNKLSLLRDKIYDEQKKIEKASYKLDIRKRRVKLLEKELNNSIGLKNRFINLFKRK